MGTAHPPPPPAPHGPTEGCSGRPLLALGGAGLGAALPSPAGEEISRWLMEGGCALWLLGPSGSGRTTSAGAAVRRVLAEHPGLLRGALRIEGTPGMRLEEALFEVNEFLRQLGISELDSVLNQRASLTAKLSILTEALRRHPVLIWFDDFECLSAAGGPDPGRHPGQCMRFFGRAWGELPGGAGRLLVVTEGEGPDGLGPEETTARLLTLDRHPAVEPALLYAHLFPDTPWPDGGLSEPGSALALCLRRAALAAADPTIREELKARIHQLSTGGLVGTIWAYLDSPARQALEVAAAFRAPLSRGALRSFLPADSPEPEEAAAAALERWGLAVRAGEEAGGALRLHPLVRGSVERLCRLADPARWNHLRKQVALHLLEAGTRTGDITFLIRARNQLFESGHHVEAYEVQKIFLEDLLRRGFYEMARKFLEESARTTRGASRAVSLGNLAIIHKNEGNLDQAVRLYEEVRLEFEAAGDLANAARVYHQLGNTHYLRGDHDLAIENYKKSLEISLETNERAVAAATRIQIANVQYVRGKHEEALESYRETLALAQELNDRNLTAAIHLQIGQLLINLRRPSEAEEELQLAEREASELGDRRNLIKVGQLLGLVAGERRDYDQAVIHLERAAETAGSLGDPLEMAACFLRIGVFEAQRVQFPRAVGAFLRALELLDTTSGGVQATGPPGDLAAYRSAVAERLEHVARQVGPEVFARILKGLGREYPYPAPESPAGQE